MAFCDSHYFEKTGVLLENLRQNEKRRLELERDLCAYYRNRNCQMSISKLQHYLKNVCEREKHAKRRNLDLMKDVEYMCPRGGALSPGRSDLHREKVCTVYSKEPIVSKSQKLQPSDVLPGRLQGSGALSTPGFPWEVAESWDASEKNGALPFLSEAGGLHKSDGSSTSRLISRSLQGTAAADASGPSLVASGSPAEDRHHPKVSSNARATKENITRPPQRPSPQNESENDASCTGDDENSKSGSVSNRTPKKPSNTSSEHSLSLNEVKDLEMLPGGSDIADTHFSETGPHRTPAEEGHTTTDVRGFSGDVRWAVSVESEVKEHGWSSVVSEVTSMGLSLEGFFHLMNSIEERLDQRENELYKISSISEEKLNNLISLCNGKAALNGVDLEACGAVVLHQFQRLSWSVSKGCVLPEEIVSANWTSADEKKIRSCLPADGSALWERWLQHAHALENSGLFTTNQIVELFTPLLVQKDASYLKKAKVLVKKILPQASDGSPSESNRSSCDLPSLLDDSEEIKTPRPDHWLKDNRKQGGQSGEEDSKEESFVESIPIRETKAYQLLKQSVAQQRRLSSEEEGDDSDVDLSVDGQMNTTRGPPMPSKSSPLRSQQGHRVWAEGGASAVKSKAFWGESDDGSSDIEAALRPTPHRTDEDFDFYD
ncbi:centrosomal protein kizuna isoform X2 [Brienomyrus brachyistius]|uniref:centrosomal protein kizuna isoform X2 n=1 Tax=Brienomyrus brachyistius TaxID=42636 RepID=UPI0020B2320A|nr:centrosomal protein kizuna isoform X2 [Brienomyrus brachyistius]